MNAKQLQEERGKLYSDIFNNKVPERMPVSMAVHERMVAALYNKPTFSYQYDVGILYDNVDEIANLIYSDTNPVPRPNPRLPLVYQALKSQSFEMGGTGVMQHPEVTGMNEEDYELLISDPYACLIERVLPRQHKALSLDDAFERSKAISFLKSEQARENSIVAPVAAQITEKYGFYKGAPRGSSSFASAPGDFLGDQLRGLSNMSIDIRRDREKVKAACEALYPLCFLTGLPSNPHPLGRIGTPLHMPMFMREKDFVEVWLPTYMRMCQQYASLGARVDAFCEQDWMRYLDILSEFPAGMALQFEYGDPKTICDKLGKKFFISGLYPLSVMKTGTKEHIIDKAKELLDIMMPMGGYIFSFDKKPLSLNDASIENLRALSEFLRDYAHYDNAGESFGTPLNSENFTFDKSLLSFDSKYLTHWDEYKQRYPFTPDFVKDILYKCDIDEMKFFMGLLI